MVHLLQALLGAIVWSVANVVYIDLKRKGIRGFTRFAAFWAGTPTTWITFFAVPDGSTPAFRPPEGDEEEHLREAIRRDRASRGIVSAEGAERREGSDPEEEDRPPAGRPGLREPGGRDDRALPLARPEDRG